MVHDLWLVVKRPLATSQKLEDATEMALVKSCWHYHNKQKKMKVQVIGSSEELKFKADQYKYVFKSTNLGGFSCLIDNLISFRERSNPYVDSML